MALFGNKNRTKVPTESLTNGHLFIVGEAGKVTDLGACTIEDLRLAAFVAQEAYVRLPSRKSKVRSNTLGRVRSFTETIYKKASGEIT